MNVKRQSSLLSCPLHGWKWPREGIQGESPIVHKFSKPPSSRESWPRRHARTWHTTSPLLWWWCEALEMFLTSRIRRGIKPVSSDLRIWGSEVSSNLTMHCSSVVPPDFALSAPPQPVADTDDFSPLTFQYSHLLNNLNAEHSNLAAHFWTYIFLSYKFTVRCKN